jgi:hypothetical protein
MITRSKSALLTEKNPEYYRVFREGVLSTFRQWTALELAVHNQWGGPSSASKADSLVSEVLALYDGKDRIYKDVCS